MIQCPKCKLQYAEASSALACCKLNIDSSGDGFVLLRASQLYWDHCAELRIRPEWANLTDENKIDWIEQALIVIKDEDEKRRGWMQAQATKPARTNMDVINDLEKKQATAGNVGIAREYGPVKVESVKLETSMYRPLGIDGVSIPASALYTIAEDLPVFDVQIAALYLGGSTFQSCDSMFDIVFHLKRCLDVDVSKPILIAADGHIMDGCHRIMRAILDGRTHLHAKRFAITPQFDEHGICVNKGE